MFLSNMEKNIWILSMILFCAGCKPSKLNDGASVTVTFGREDFVRQQELHNPTEIVFDSLLNPTAFYLMYDTLVVVQNQPNCDYLIEMYSLTTRERVGKFAPKGGGPDDYLSCLCFVRSGSDSVINLIDQQLEICHIVQVSSSIATERLQERKRFRYNPEIHPYSDICIPNDTHYIGYNMWYLNSPKYNNHVPAIKRYAIEDQQNSRIEHAYFVASVNNARLAVSPITGEIWLLDSHQDKISIYNDSLQIVKILSGPDGYRIFYSDIQTNIPTPFVTFADNKMYRSYTNYTCTDKHIYVIYEGVNGTNFNPEDLKPVEVLKFDWMGNLLCIYKIDRYIYTISVDSREEYLYCTARTSYLDEAYFFKYKL